MYEDFNFGNDHFNYFLQYFSDVVRNNIFDLISYIFLDHAWFSTGSTSIESFCAFFMYAESLKKK